MVTKVTNETNNTTKNQSEGKSRSDDKPWINHMGKLGKFRKETKRINKVIEEAFEQVDYELWIDLGF